jgi:polyisoprenoid-binding protein YceI
MRLHKRLLLFAALALALPVLAADTYQIDPAHTSVGFSISHMVLSKVKGTFNEFSGTLSYDEQAQPAITAVNTISFVRIMSP